MVVRSYTPLLPPIQTTTWRIHSGILSLTQLLYPLSILGLALRISVLRCRTTCPVGVLVTEGVGIIPVLFVGEPI